MSKLEKLVYILTSTLKEGESVTVTLVLTKKNGKVEAKTGG